MSFTKKKFFTRITICLLPLILLSSCFQSLSPRSEKGSVIIHIAVPSSPSVTDTNSDVRFIHPDTKKVIMTVTAPDMETVTETKNLSSEKSEIVIEVNTISSGLNRKIDIELKDADNHLIAKGSITANIQANIQNPISITAIPVNTIILGVDVSSDPIPSSMKGKTLVYSVDVDTAGPYEVSSYPVFDSPIVFNMFDSAGKKVTANPVESNSFYLSTESYYLTATLPSDYEDGLTIKISEKITENPTYTLTYDGNGNTSGTAPVDTKKYVSDATVTVAAAGTLAKTGATFAGWNTFANGSGTTYAVNETFSMGNTDVTLYAKWIMGNLSVTVSFENPTEPEFSLPANSEVAVGNEITISAVTGFTSYKWILNNVDQDETGNKIILMAESSTPNIIIPGLNAVTLVVLSGGEYYSAEFVFKIVQ